MMALKNGIELVQALRYKLRMFGAPFEGATNIYCENEAVYKNCSIPYSTFRNKHHSIAYHRNREEVAAGTCQIRRREIEDKSQWLVHQDLSSIFIESDQARKVSGCSLFLWLLVLQPEIALAPRAIPRAIPRATTSSELHILHYNSFGILEFEARLLNPGSCNDSLSSWCKLSLGNKTSQKMAVSPIR